MDDVETKARQIWDKREAKMPARVQQTWEQGTELARQATIYQACRELDITPPMPCEMCGGLTKHLGRCPANG